MDEDKFVLIDLLSRDITIDYIEERINENVGITYDDLEHMITMAKKISAAATVVQNLQFKEEFYRRNR